MRTENHVSFFLQIIFFRKYHLNKLFLHKCHPMRNSFICYWKEMKLAMNYWLVRENIPSSNVSYGWFRTVYGHNRETTTDSVTNSPRLTHT